MKGTNIFTHGLLWMIIAIFMIPAGISAQDSGEPEDQPDKFKKEELVQMLAPIALYPDSLIAQILMASTYPLEVVEAERWMRQNKELRGVALDAALRQKNWDSSVQSLCHFPDILFAMSEILDQTRKLGDAFLRQEDEVMATIKELRYKAQEQGNLKTTENQEVIIEQDTIFIQPTNPEVIYVPVYDPLYVYGPWWYPAYPPYYWYYPSGYVVSGGYIGFGPPVYFGLGFSWAWFDWHTHHIHVDHDKARRFHRYPDHRGFDQPFWRHAPSHRRGVAYRDRGTSERYGIRSPQMRPTSPETRGYPTRSLERGTPSPSRSPVQRRGAPVTPQVTPRPQGVQPAPVTPQVTTKPQNIQRAPVRDTPFRGIGDANFERKAAERGGESRRSIEIKRSGGDTRRQGGEIRRQGSEVRQPSGSSQGSGRGGGFRR
ncbi:MAG TPA: DUF3300 domain-containing protein [Thermodesulfovibrionales bacterium]|jgi:hypothetical protein|nr:DUF3300 domain-containing protein [Thermodesulfovibrionales bacterium]